MGERGRYSGLRHKRQKKKTDEENKRELVHWMERSPKENAGIELSSHCFNHSP